MRYRRANIEGGTYFFTVVTFGRKKIFSTPENVELLRQGMKHVMKKHPFVIDAMVVLPDHLHCIWTLPPEDADFPVRWRLIKSFFTRNCGAEYRQKISDARQRKKEQALWQRRYWEHTIKDEQAFMRHVEYIHYNPVKHGLVNAPGGWAYSSFHQYVKQGRYPENWGAGVVLDFDDGVGCE